MEDPVTVLPYDLASCVAGITKAAGSDGTVTINWTGGTKIMSYAARRIADTKPCRALYINTADRQLLVEDSPASGVVRTEPLNSIQLGLNTLVHILASGHKVENGTSLNEFRAAHSPRPELQAAAEMVLDAPGYYWSDMFALTRAIEKAFAPRRLPLPFLRSLEAAKVIQVGEQPGTYLIGAESLGRPFHRSAPQDENAKFIKGGYLEVFLWSQLKSRGAFDDVAWHVRINPGQQGRGAEFDVVVASDGRFVVVESKGRIDLGDLANLVEEQNARTRRVGRLFSQWILYIHQFRGEFDTPDSQAIIASQEERAKDFGGHLVWRDDLVDLPVLVGGFLNEERRAL